MSDRVRELLVKAIRQLDQAEQDEVLGELLTESGAPWAAAVEAPVARGVLGFARVPGAAPVPLGGPGPDRAELVERVSAMVGPGGDLKMLPVRLPAADYERLRAWSREHGFSMAVIIRTLVERFLDGRNPSAARSAESG